ncbi:MAG: hypothetical protein OWT27_10070 [Firmicutes bacterium]|nr:hypothetical protein [Bacillota bacterium]
MKKPDDEESKRIPDWLKVLVLTLSAILGGMAGVFLHGRGF